MHIWKMPTVSIIWKAKKYTVTTIRGKIETPHTQIHGRSLSLSLHMKRGGFKIKTVLIIVYSIGNLSCNNLYTFCHLSFRSFYVHVAYTARYLNICNFKDSEAKMIYLFQLWNSYDARIPEQGVSQWFLLNASSAIFQLYHGKKKLIFNEIMIRSALY